ncbi:hybrid sensor histidine kinase/response regulator [Desulfospira joergensenii]|uniref:hybrid sensor histidine kinase/response regulator n=1 Tax=Desulfospira joergensenii TaxID=53329 RepID=UPI0003B76B0A|nr:hybrid sensor histidine kinase/response regulator [Desulfospira joergensenii]
MRKNELLILDDQKQVLSSLKRILKREPYHCHFALNVDDALSIIQKNSIHVVLSDIKMPGRDGIEFLTAIAKDYPDIIRLAISADSASKTVLKAINDGNILRYITKPWNDIELVNFLRQAFDLYNLKQDKRHLLRKLQEYNIELENKVERRTRELFSVLNAAEIGKHTSQIVHNLNNPLNSIFGALQMIEVLIESSPQDLSGIRRFVDMAKTKSGDMGQIISSILVHIRDHGTLYKESIDLNELIKTELKLYEIDPFFKKKIEKKIDLDHGLPAISGNQVQLKQIFDNLIKNSIDAMEHTPEKKLSVQTAHRNDSIVVRVKDTGCGIPKEQIHRIFSPDFTTKPIGKGTGLGLASVKAMVEGYHGVIRVDSEPDKGTIFTIELPTR